MELFLLVNLIIKETFRLGWSKKNMRYNKIYFNNYLLKLIAHFYNLLTIYIKIFFRPLPIL